MYLNMSHYLTIFPQENYTRDAIHHAQLAKAKVILKKCQVILKKYKSAEQKIKSRTSKFDTNLKQLHPDFRGSIILLIHPASE